MKKVLFVLTLMLSMVFGSVIPTFAYDFNEGDQEIYSAYIDELAKNTTENDAEEENLLNRGEQYSNLDYAIMKNVGKKWNELFMNNWKPYIYSPEENGKDGKATVLANSGIPDSEKHAFVCLGFQLKDGEMLPELKGRCQTVAAAARQFPKTKIYVSGGPTGPNNPDKHTEARLMRDYLVNECGIDSSRVYMDERAMTTVQNAENTFAMLQENGIESITIVTSNYHTRRGTLLYYAESQLFEYGKGYKCNIIGNLGYYIEGKDLEPASHAARSLKQILGLPNTVKTTSQVINNQYIYDENDPLDITVYEEKLGAQTEIKDYKVKNYDPHRAGLQTIDVIHLLEGKETTSKVNVFVKYKFISGDNSVFDKGKASNIVLKTNGVLDKLTGIYLDDKELDKNAYTLASGSTILTLKKEALSNLSNGNHKIKLVYGKEDKIETNLVIAPDSVTAAEVAKQIKNNTYNPNNALPASTTKNTKHNTSTKTNNTTSKSAETSDPTSIKELLFMLLGSLGISFFLLKKKMS